jgi:GNAT superfamily N-acetyltransferase
MNVKGINYKIHNLHFLLNNKSAGFLTESKYIDDPSSTWIRDFYVKEKSQGIGKIMMQEFLEKASEDGHIQVGLGVDKKNFPAIKLYRGFGFEEYKEKETPTNYSLWRDI